MSDGRKLFDEVVKRSGLAAWLGPGTVQRALHAVGIASPEDARAADYRRAMPQLRARMALYLRAEELDRTLRDIEALLS